MWLPNMLLGGLGVFAGPGVDPEVFTYLSQVISVVSTILPVSQMMNIVWFSLGIKGIQIAWSLILRIKSFIPFFGGA